MVEVFPLL